MSNIITNHPEQFIFAHDQDLVTTSVKVADAFGKLHKNIIAKIKSLDIPEDFSRLNFKLCYKNNELQNGKPQPFYEMTKDGFMLIVMGFTGKKAMEVKIAYITAFNMMHSKLFPKTQYGLKEAPKLTPAQQRHIQKRVAELVGRQVGTSYNAIWGRLKDHFHVGTYKDIPAHKYPEVCEYLRCKPIEGELLRANEGLFGLNIEITDPRARFLLTQEGGETRMVPVDPNAYILTRDEIKRNIHEVVPGYRLVDVHLYALCETLKDVVIKRHEADMLAK